MLTREEVYGLNWKNLSYVINAEFFHKLFIAVSISKTFSIWPKSLFLFISMIFIGENLQSHYILCIMSPGSGASEFVSIMLSSEDVEGDRLIDLEDVFAPLRPLLFVFFDFEIFG